MTIIEVLYKDYGKFDGDVHLVNEEFACWNEEGAYTLFYKEYKDKKSPPTIIIPTHAVCWIKPKVKE